MKIDLSDKEIEKLIEKFWEFPQAYQSEILSERLLESSKEFRIWSGSSSPDKHHYGRGGLLTHTYEVVKLCLTIPDTLNLQVDKTEMFYSALYHDIGKIYAYKRVKKGLGKSDKWVKDVDFIRKIGHVSKSASIWKEEAKYVFDDDFVDRVTHNILSHHGPVI